MKNLKKAYSGKNITAYASVGILVSSGVVGCGGNVARQQDWMVTSVATGRINLDAVKDALETSKDIDEFERRVNEIYEGDNLVLIKVEDQEAQTIISGFEDLNQSYTIEEANDDKLFSIILEEKRYEVYGYGYNQYYYYGSDYGHDYDYDDDHDRRFMHGLMYKQESKRDQFTYQTNRQRAAQLRRNRDRFRNSSDYTAQRGANNAFFARQKASNPQAFRSSPKNVSSQRSSYRQRQLSRVEASRPARASGKSSGNIRGGS